jgi:hypothetical protein
MIPGVRGIKLEAFVGLRKLAVHARGASGHAVGVAAKAKFVLGCQRVGNGAGSADAFDPGERARSVRRGGGGSVRGMRVVAIGAFDMTRRVDGILGWIMNPGGVQDRMGAELVEFGLDVFGSDVAAMARKAVFLFIGEVQQARFGSRIMRRVTVLGQGLLPTPFQVLFEFRCEASCQ